MTQRPGGEGAAAANKRPPFVRLKELRNARGWSQEELGRHIGKTGHAVFNWENGVTVPRMDALAALSDVLNVSIDYILERPARENGVTADPEEVRLLFYYRELNGEGKKAMIDHVALLSSTNKYRREGA